MDPSMRAIDAAFRLRAHVFLRSVEIANALFCTRICHYSTNRPDLHPTSLIPNSRASPATRSQITRTLS
jgi:hypothetical protein